MGPRSISDGSTRVAPPTQQNVRGAFRTAAHALLSQRTRMHETHTTCLELRVNPSATSGKLLGGQAAHGSELVNGWPGSYKWLASFWRLKSSPDSCHRT